MKSIDRIIKLEIDYIINQYNEYANLDVAYIPWCAMHIVSKHFSLNNFTILNNYYNLTNSNPELTMKLGARYTRICNNVSEVIRKVIEKISKLNSFI